MKPTAMIISTSIVFSIISASCKSLFIEGNNKSKAEEELECYVTLKDQQIKNNVPLILSEFG